MQLCVYICARAYVCKRTGSDEWDAEAWQREVWQLPSEQVEVPARVYVTSAE